MCLCRKKPKKKPHHITKVSTTFMLFHVELFWAASVNQSLIFINNTLWTVLQRLNSIQQVFAYWFGGIPFCTCFVAQVKLP
jgi:hypothetical protein